MSGLPGVATADHDEPNHPDQTESKDMLDRLRKLGRTGSKESDQPRREVREEVVDGMAVIQQQRFPIKNWSASGFCIGPTLMSPNPGEPLDIEFTISLPDPTLNFEARTAITRLDKEKMEFAGVFFRVEDDIRKSIDKHFGTEEEKGLAEGLLGSLKSVIKRG